MSGEGETPRRIKAVVFTLVAVLALAGAVGLIYYARVAGQPLRCQVCGRQIPKQTAFQIVTTKGTLRACCPRCAMHYMLHHPGEIRGARATDAATGRIIDAQSAFYDEGGEVQYCTFGKSMVEHGPEQGERVRVYDRCLPVLVAFATRAEAESYQQRHGGRILTYAEALESVRRR